jgi:hypothetical protein
LTEKTQDAVCPIYIPFWEKNFEVAQSRRDGSHKWVAMPTKQDGKGYRRLVRHPRGWEFFGIWCAMVELAAKQSTRGVFQDENGPLSVDDIADAIGASSEQAQSAMEILASPGIDWLCLPTQSQLGATSEPAMSTRQDTTIQDKTTQHSAREIVKLEDRDPNTDPALIVAEVVEMYRLGGKNAPQEHADHAVRVLIGKPPATRHRLRNYVAWAFATGQWPNPAKTKSLYNLLRDGDWDVDLSMRTLPEVSNPARLDTTQLAAAEYLKRKAAREKAAHEPN